MRNPMQPMTTNQDGYHYFKANEIVKYILIASQVNIDEILCDPKFTDDDKRQFMQLVGFSLNRYGDMSCVDTEAYEIASVMADDPEITEEAARIGYLENLLDTLRDKLEAPVAELYGVSRYDFKRFLKENCHE